MLVFLSFCSSVYICACMVLCKRESDSQLYFVRILELWIYLQMNDTQPLKLIQFSFLGWRHSNPSHLQSTQAHQIEACMSYDLCAFYLIHWLMPSSMGPRQDICFPLKYDFLFYFCFSFSFCYCFGLILPVFSVDGCVHHRDFDVN